MGETHTVWSPFFIGERPDDLIRRTIRTLIDHGFATTSDGDTDRIERYKLEGDDRYDHREDATLDEVIEAARTTDDVDTVTIRVWMPDTSSIRVEFNDEESTIYPALFLSGPDEWELGDKGDVDYDVARERSDRLADAIAALAEEFDPWYAFAHVRHPYDEGEVFPTDEESPLDSVDALPWMTVFGGESLDRLGGRERLLDAPTWRVRGLEAGGVFLRSHDVPERIRTDATGGSDIPTYDYVFERESIDDLHAEIERQQSTYLDPFRDLDEGELASDPVMCEYHASFDFDETRMDYTAFPDDLSKVEDSCHVLCVRREGNKLWEANNGEFIRRLVDEDGQPIGDLPDGVPYHQEMISLAVETEYETGGSPPHHMYEMDTPDDPSVLAQLIGLHRIPEGTSIWADEDEPVTRD